jgi:hypothetical protein
MCAAKLPQAVQNMVVAELKDSKQENDYEFKPKLYELTEEIKESTKLLEHAEQALNMIPEGPHRMTHANSEMLLKQAASMLREVREKTKHNFRLVEELSTMAKRENERFNGICDIVKDKYNVERDAVVEAFSAVDIDHMN